METAVYPAVTVDDVDAEAAKVAAAAAATLAKVEARMCLLPPRPAVM